MKTASVLGWVLLAGAATSGLGQTSGKASAAKPKSAAQTHAQQMAHNMNVPKMSNIAEVLDTQVTTLEKGVLRLAEAMPEDQFDFHPTNLNLPDSRDPVRTFAGQLKHMATDNYDIWSPLTGDPVPANIKDVNGPEELKTKAEIMEFLKGSFAEGHKAAATVNAKNAVEGLEFRGMQMPRLFLATYAIEHAMDHYGQLVIYLRLAGVTPPGSRK